jgi:hypothetical protein
MVLHFILEMGSVVVTPEQTASLDTQDMFRNARSQDLSPQDVSSLALSLIGVTAP